MVDSRTHMNLQIFVKPVDSRSNLSQLIHLKKNGIRERKNHIIMDMMRSFFDNEWPTKIILVLSIKLEHSYFEYKSHTCC
jgi:hypothetical protein